jgi:hypothetical protein
MNAQPHQRIQITREQLELAQDWIDLPENERMSFKRAIAERAVLWRDESIEFTPTIVVRMVRLVDT